MAARLAARADRRVPPPTHGADVDGEYDGGGADAHREGPVFEGHLPHAAPAAPCGAPAGAAAAATATAGGRAVERAAGGVHVYAAARCVPRQGGGHDDDTCTRVRVRGA